MGLLLIFSSCGGSSDSGTNGKDSAPGPSATDRSFTRSVQNSGAQAAKIHQSTIDIIKTASNNFELDLTADPAPEAAVEPVTNSLGELLEEANKALATHYQLIELIDKAEPLTDSQGLRTQRDPLLFTAAVTIAGTLLVGYTAKKQIDTAINQRTNPTAEKLANATEAELQIARDELNLSGRADRQAILDTFNNAGSSRKLTYSKNIEAALRDAVVENTPDVDNVDTMKLRKAVSKSSVTLGETAVTSTVAVATSATGGQGMTQAFKAAGLSSKAAAVADLTVSAVSTATGESLQPLDVLTESLTVTAVSEDKQTVEVPEPEKEMTVKQAIKKLENPENNEKQLETAAKTIVRDAAKRTQTASEEKPDGSIDVEIPAKIHRTVVEDIKNETTFKIPDIGISDIVITAKDHIPQVFTEIDLSTSPSIKFQVDTGEAIPEPPSNGGGDDAKWCREYNRVCVSEPAERLDYCEESTAAIKKTGCLEPYNNYLRCVINNNCEESQECTDALNRYTSCLSGSR